MVIYRNCFFFLFNVKKKMTEIERDRSGEEDWSGRGEVD